MPGLRAMPAVMTTMSELAVVVVAVGSGQRGVIAVDRPGLQQVERLALRNALDDVDQHDVAELLLDDVLRHGGADVAGAHDGDLGRAITRPFRA